MTKLPIIIATFCSALLGSLATSGGGALAQSGHRFESGRQVGDIDQVQVALEVGGDLLEDVRGKVERNEMSVVGDFSYHEKTLRLPTPSDATMRTTRWYDKAVAVIKSEAIGIKPSLPPERNPLVVEAKLPEITMFSPQGPLSGEQLDLVDFLGNSVLYDRLLPKDAVQDGASWELPQPVVASLLRMDVVQKSDVQCTLSEVTDTLARFQLTGTAEGLHAGASTRVELRGKYRFDRQRRRVDWFALLMKEQRQLGPIEAGLDVVVRLQVVIKPGVSFDKLGEAELAGLRLEPTPELRKLFLESADGDWQLLRDRRWQDVSAKGQHRTVVALRMVDQGQFIAHCNMSQLPKQPPEKPATLEQYQADVKQALGKQLGEFVEAGQSHSDADYRVFRVVANGKVDERPVRWIYYLVADRDGRQTALAFSVEGDLLERFGKADEELVDGFRFLTVEDKATAGVPPKSSPK